MSTFIRELWELWYWSLFSPLKLNQRIQEWVPASSVIRERGLPPTDDDITETLFSDIMWWDVQPGIKASRIRTQYLILVALSTLPLATACLVLGGIGDILLWVAITMLCVAFGAVIPSLGLVMPWMAAWIYLQSPGFANAVLANIALKSPPVNRIAISLAVVAAILAAVTRIVTALRQPQSLLAAVFLGIGEAGSIAAGAAVIYPENSELIYLFGGMALFTVWVSTGIEEKGMSPDESRMHRIPIGMGVALAVELCFAFIAGPANKTSEVVVSLVLVLTMISYMLLHRVFFGATSSFYAGNLGRNLARSLLWGLIGGFILPMVVGFLLAWGHCPLWLCVGLAYLVGFAVAPSRVCIRPLKFGIEIVRASVEETWRGILSLPLVVLKEQEFFWMEALGYALVIPVCFAAASGYWAFICLPAILLGYCRILPDWPLLTLTALWRRSCITSATSAEVLAWLHDMPPYAYDIALLPIPGHVRFWALLFKKNPSIALEAISHAFSLAYSTADQWTQVQTWQRIQPLVSNLPASERSALVRQSLLARNSTEAIAKFARKTFPTAILLKDFCEDPETKGPWASNGDIEQFVPLFKEVATKVAAAHAAEHPVEQERGLEAAAAEIASTRLHIRDLGIDVEAWLDVVDHWERLLRASIDALGVPQGELLQPFQAGGALRPERSHLFKGRRQLTEQVASEIAGVGRSPLILHGPRQCGKSSFLLHFSRLSPTGISPVYVDLQSQAITSSESELCFRVITKAIRDLRGVCPRVQQLPNLDRADFQPNPYPVFEDWLDLVLDSIGDNRLLICIDEFENLGKAMDRGHLSTAIFDELRHLSQHRDRLRFIFCGAQTFEELGPQWTHYFITSKPIEIRYLEPDEARELLKDPDPKFGLKYAPGVLDRIIGLTACQPYLVQLVGEAMVKVACIHNTRVIDNDLLDAAIKEALPAGAFYFSSLWGEATGRTPEEISSGQILLCTIADKRALPPLEGPTRAALQRLQRYHVIAKDDDGYRIEIPLVAQWLRERKVGDVLGEMGVSYS